MYNWPLKAYQYLVLLVPSLTRCHKHHVCSCQWAKITRNLKLPLALDRPSLLDLGNFAAKRRTFKAAQLRRFESSARAREVITCTQPSKASETVFCRNYHSLGFSNTCFEIFWVFLPCRFFNTFITCYEVLAALSLVSMHFMDRILGCIT